MPKTIASQRPAEQRCVDRLTMNHIQYLPLNSPLPLSLSLQSLLYYVIELIRAVCAFSARLEISILFVSQPQPLVIPTPPEVADGATI